MKLGRLGASVLALMVSVTALVAPAEATSAPAPAPTGATSTRPGGPTKFGFAVWRHVGENYAAALARQSAALGKPEIIRYFNGANPLVWPVEGGATGNTPLIYSFKRPPAAVAAGAYDAEISAWLAKLPTTRRTWIAYEHEMDMKVAHGEYTAADAKSAFAHVTELIRATGNPKLKATLILTGFDYAKRLPQFYPGGKYVDVLGVDTYQWTTESVPQMLSTNMAIAASYKKQFGLSEFGLWQGADEARAGYIKEAVQAADEKMAWMTYFDCDRSATPGDHDWEISDMPASAEAWRTAVAATH
mgnify:CR=1 FL=1